MGRLLALWLTVPGGLSPQNRVLLNNVNLIFYEARHVLLMLLGETVMLLDGSFFQLFVPTACAAFFWQRGDRYSVRLMPLWTAQPLANVSVYVANAPTGNLDLITGDPDTHDWWQLFTKLGNLGAAVPIGKTVHFLSLVITLWRFVVAMGDDVNEMKTVSGDL